MASKSKAKNTDHRMILGSGSRIFAHISGSKQRKMHDKNDEIKTISRQKYEKKRNL